MQAPMQTLETLGLRVISKVHLQQNALGSLHARIRLTVAVALFPLRELHLTRPLLDDIAVGDACRQNPDRLSLLGWCQCVLDKHQLQLAPDIQVCKPKDVQQKGKQNDLRRTGAAGSRGTLAQTVA